MSASGFVYRRAKSLVGPIAALAVLVSVATFATAAPPKPTLEYNFDASKDNLTTPGGIRDLSGNKYNGTEFSAGAGTSFGPGHLPTTTAIYLLGDDDVGSGLGATGAAGGTGIDTGIDTGSVGIDSGPFTVMAWVNRFSFKGDHMVFGTMNNAAPDLHLGFRKSQAYSGFWGNDSGVIVHIGIYEWHHFAVSHDGKSPGVQAIYIDGVPVSKEANHNPYVGSGVDLTIGHTFGNGGAFCGAIEHPRVYGGVALMDDQIAADAADLPIPP